jgi:hypothetical protein
MKFTQTGQKRDRSDDVMETEYDDEPKNLQRDKDGSNDDGSNDEYEAESPRGVARTVNVIEDDEDDEDVENDEEAVSVADEKEKEESQQTITDIVDLKGRISDNALDVDAEDDNKSTISDGSNASQSLTNLQKLHADVQNAKEKLNSAINKAPQDTTKQQHVAAIGLLKEKLTTAEKRLQLAELKQHVAKIKQDRENEKKQHRKEQQIEREHKKQRLLDSKMDKLKEQ